MTDYGLIAVRKDMTYSDLRLEVGRKYYCNDRRLPDFNYVKELIHDPLIGAWEKLSFFIAKFDVDMKDFQNYGVCSDTRFGVPLKKSCYRIKPKSFILLEEITESFEVLEAIRYQGWKIETLEDFKLMREKGYMNFYKEKIAEKLKHIFSNDFMNCFLFKKMTNSGSIIKNGNVESKIVEEAEEKANKILALFDEGLCKEKIIEILFPER